MADVYVLPFDVVYMIAMIGEIHYFEKALKEFHRVMSSSCILVFRELFTDPDYSLAKTLIRRCNSAGFRLKEKIGNLFSYTLLFEKDKSLWRKDDQFSFDLPYS